MENKQTNKQQINGRWKLLFIIAVCVSPLILSYLTYYVIKPEGRTNYGALIDPKAYPIPKMDIVNADGKQITLDAFKGKWIMLHIDSGACSTLCSKKLLDMRQLRIAQGKERNRVERVWLVTDDKPIDPALLKEYEGMHVLRVKPDALLAWLPVEQSTGISDHIYLIDPLGNLMMRFPKEQDANKVKKDLSKLLKASGIG